jgi:hypothetical protein
MAYILTKSNGRVFATVSDGSIDQSASLTFVGKNYAGYGQILGQNFLYLLENFANISAPINPLQGQIWYDTANGKLKVYNGLTFKSISFTDVSTVSPADGQIGDFWFNPSNNELSIRSGVGFTAISGSGGGGGGVLTIVKDINNNSRSVLRISLENQNIAIFSLESFSVNLSETAIVSQFPYINKGLTFSNTTAGGSSAAGGTILWGTAATANQATTVAINSTTNVTSGQASTGTYANSLVVRDGAGNAWATQFYNANGIVGNGFTGSAGAPGLRGFTGSAGSGFVGSAGATGFTGSSGNNLLSSNNTWTGSNNFSSGLLVSNNIDINAGNIDGTAIGSSSPNIGIFSAITGRVAVSVEVSGTLTIASANRQILANGNITIPAGIFSSGDIIIIDPNGTNRTINTSGGLTMYFNNTAVSSVTLQANGIMGVKFRSPTVCVISGNLI